MLFPAWAFWLALAAVDVAGDGDCPSLAEVNGRLAAMMPPRAGDSGPRHRARLSRHDKTVHVELQSARGDRIDERDLEAGESCRDLASAVAVVIATWEADLDPRLIARVSLPAAPSPSAPPLAVVQVLPRQPRSPPTFDVGLALLASLTGGQVSPGARVGGWIAPGGWPIGLGAAVAAATTRAEAVGSRPGAARWTRVAFGAGPQGAFAAGGATLDAHLHALAALLHVEGSGLTTNASDNTAQFGLEAGLHVGRWWGNARPWVGADLLLWPGHDRLHIGGESAESELPRLELQLAVGVNVGRIR